MALDLAYRWIKSFCETSPIKPERDCYDFEKECEICCNPIKPAICVMVCKCQKYCHYNCLNQKFSFQIIENYSQPRCEVCQEIIKIQYDIEMVYKPKLQFCLAIQLFLALAFLTWCSYLLVQGVLSMQNSVRKLQNEIMIQIVLGSMGILLSCGWMFILCKKIIWKREKRINTIYAQNVDMTRPFETELPQQITNDQINHEQMRQQQALDNVQIN